MCSIFNRVVSELKVAQVVVWNNHMSFLIEVVKVVF
jgi:hypothetical protein